MKNSTKKSSTMHAKPVAAVEPKAKRTESLSGMAEREVFGLTGDLHYRNNEDKSLGDMLVRVLAWIGGGNDTVSAGLDLIADELDILQMASTTDEFADADGPIIENTITAINYRLRVLAEMNRRVLAKVDEMHAAEIAKVGGSTAVAF